MTRVGQKIFEKKFAGILVRKISDRENNKIIFLRNGIEGADTDLIYCSNNTEIGVEVMENYHVDSKNKPINISKVKYTKNSDMVSFLTKNLKNKKSKNYLQKIKWLLIVNRIQACGPNDFSLIMNGHWTQTNFDRVFVCFEIPQRSTNFPDEFEIYEVAGQDLRLVT